VNLVISVSFFNKMVSKFGCADWFSCAVKMKKFGYDKTHFL
jgi:hypothetical protein